VVASAFRLKERLQLPVLCVLQVVRLRVQALLPSEGAVIVLVFSNNCSCCLCKLLFCRGICGATTLGSVGAIGSWPTLAGSGFSAGRIIICECLLCNVIDTESGVT
jgi:hypothetical protein